MTKGVASTETTERGTCTCARFPHEHPRQYLCGIGFNEFLGEVQHRLIKLGYEPPLWPDPTIRDQGDLDEALDVCVKWCAARLDEAKRPSPPENDAALEFVDCTLCAASPGAEGFYTGCMVKDGLAPGWSCDGKGKLVRWQSGNPATPLPAQEPK